MNSNLPTLTASALVLAITTAVYADEKSAVDSAKAPAPPPAQVSAGLVNDWLREQSSLFDPWDLGGSVRGRYEVKDGYGI